ncbi:putative ferric-chelate reductase 1 [Argopecten irradians]|uniref:putative ferric-chelate reductase 1 n=1 Tax=Argopecten irradians TaxID=31199 RepID=UPI003712D8AB
MTWIKFACILIACVYIEPTTGFVPPDPACGTTRTCWPAECPNTGCNDFQISWWNTNSGYLRFQMRVDYAVQGEHYIALGFSANKQMADSSIVMCRSDANVELGYTPAERRYLSRPNFTGLRNTSFNVTNTITTCWFDRIIEPSESEMRTLTNSFYLLRAWGPVENGAPAQHAARGSSADTFAYPTQVAAGHSVFPATTTIGGGLVMSLLILLLP